MVRLQSISDNPSHSLVAIDLLSHNPLCCWNWIRDFLLFPTECLKSEFDYFANLPQFKNNQAAIDCYFLLLHLIGSVAEFIHISQIDCHAVIGFLFAALFLIFLLN
ncbi:hypothetical protein L1987_59423 [Smallanthus sonchifolius]|uniref:Uncharacterized protein n=1 Tax=Smallanthus sonchifolius TaxID=185202 RepID=A0ACB9D590_9ASTR|nr:hypothetical protein L1987_59423 [Smallanthus sonchifolius]